MASQYFIKRDGQESGPFGFKELVVFVREGKLVHSDPVRFSWTTEWQRADSLVGLFHMARKLPDEIAQHGAPPVDLRPPLASEPIPALPDEPANIAPTEDRPGWIMRLMDVGRFRRKRPADSSVPGPDSGTPAEITAACSSLPEDPSLDSPAAGSEAAPSRTATGSPSEQLPAELAAFLSHDGSTPDNRWATTVEEALTAANARGPRKPQKLRAGRLRRIIGGLARVIPHGDERQSLMRNGFRIVCAIACANLAAWAVDNWSAQEALRFPSRDAQISSLRHFPVIGTCGSGEYLFLMFDLMLAAGAAAWFAAGWLESRAE